MIIDKCFYCNKEFGILELRFYVRKAIKPKFYNNRWEYIGYACEDCSSKKLSFEYGENKK